MNKIAAKRGLAFQDNDTVEITIATNAGACFGVVRAVKLAHQAVNRSKTRGGQLYSLGPLIHNPHVIEALAEKGVRTIATANDAESGTVVLRSHGVQVEVEQALRQRGLTVVDATCPLVKKPQRIAQSVGEKGYYLVVVGDADHPEVKGVVSYFGRPDYLVLYDPRRLAEIPVGVEQVAVLAQTTIEVAVFDAVVAEARERFSDVVAYNTICDATSIRQGEAERLAKSADVVVVVGGKNSSNTSKLVKICRAFQSETYHIEHRAEVHRSWFTGKRKIGVTAGASTPHEYVDEVGEHIAQLIQTTE